MKKMRFWAVIMLVATLGAMLLSACGSAAQNVPMIETKGMDEMMPEAMPQAVAGGNALRSSDVETFAAAVDMPEAVQRLVIRNADMDIVVADPKQAADDIARMAEQMGGYVVSANVHTRRSADDVEMLYGHIMVRVPAEKFDEAVEQIGNMAERIDRKEITGQDVTAEYVDLESRLKNLEATEAQLQRIMNEAVSTEDVLSVYQELSRVRGEIEQVKGRMKYLRDSARMSAISVNLTPSEAAKPFTIGGWQPVGVAKDAILMLLRTLRGLANIVIWLLLYFVPVLLILGLVFGYPAWWLLRKGYRRWLKPKKPAEKTDDNGK